MNIYTDENIQYKKIAEAIEYIRSNFKDQPDLDDIARHVNTSPSHFQRLFTDWVGTSPKRFLQYISIEYAKSLLRENQPISLFDTTLATGLSSTSRLHDLFIKIEGMTPAEYKNCGKELNIHYFFYGSPFGKLIMASTTKGICYITFEEDESIALNNLREKFPNAVYHHKMDENQQRALLIFRKDWNSLPTIKLHLKATPFQLKVWETLLKIPIGKLSTYQSIAKQIGNPNASRAVGTAIGQNPIAYIIPCHRVIQSTGNIGGYMWGSVRKTAIIGWEAAVNDIDQ